MLYMNRYVNCGDGVIEHTMLRHNIQGSSTTYGYLNVPWGGTRASVLRDIVITSASNGHELVSPLPPWGAGSDRQLKDTL